MKKRKFIAVLLTICLIMSMAMPVMAYDSDDIAGDSTLQNVVFSVTVPTDLDFALDPAQITDGPSQISNVDFKFENTSTFATLVAFYLDIETADDVELKLDAAMDDFALFTASDKELSFGAIVAKTDDGSDVEYDEDNSDSIVEPNVSTGKLEFGMVLAGTHVKIDGTATDPTAAASNTDDLNASFQFFSRMNAYANWKPDDVKVSGVYLLVAVNPKTLEGGVIEANTTGLVKGGLPVVIPPAVGFMEGTGLSNIKGGFTHANGVIVSGTADFEFDEADGDGKIIPFRFLGTDITQFFYSEDNVIFGVRTYFAKDAGGVKLDGAFWDTLGAGDYVLGIALDDGTTWLVYLTVK